MIQVSVEDYMRVIYSLYEEDKKAGVRSVDVAKRLNVTKPNVSVMVKKLANKGYLKARPYSNIFLTKKGLKEAKRITHNYRVIEVFLTKVLGHDPKKVYKEAHKLEHAFSEETIRRIDRFLQNPKTCPHGKKIHD
jgi:DtxR family Mn-dependent transcriptional regulator